MFIGTPTMFLVFWLGKGLPGRRANDSQLGNITEEGMYEEVSAQLEQ